MNSRIKTYLDQENFRYLGSSDAVFKTIKQSTSPDYVAELRDFINGFKKQDSIPPGFYHKMAEKIGETSLYDICKSRFRPETEWALKNILKEISGYNIKICDIGCGTGLEAVFFAQILNKGFVIGSDISLEMIKRARERAKKRDLSNIIFLQADRDSLPLNHNYFDALICLDALTEGDSYPPRDPEFYKHIFTMQRLEDFRILLKKGGKLILTIPLQYLEEFKECVKDRKDYFSRNLKDSGFKAGRILHFKNSKENGLCQDHLFVPGTAV